MKKNVHILYGQFGYAFSAGMHSFGETLKPRGFNVQYWNYGQHHEAALAIAMTPKQDKNAVAGFSLGGNACAWIANDPALNNKEVLDLVVAYDPTVNGPSLADYPISMKVKRAICYRQMGYVLTSFFAGRGYLRRSPLGPEIETYRFTADHLVVPYMQSLHEKTLKALEEM